MILKIKKDFFIDPKDWATLRRMARIISRQKNVKVTASSLIRMAIREFLVTIEDREFQKGELYES